MAFGARNEDGWRLCWRKGKTIRTVFAGRYEIAFKSQAKAKACADALNETYWKSYFKRESKLSSGDLPEVDVDVFWGVLEVIRQHGGINHADEQKLWQT